MGTIYRHTPRVSKAPASSCGLTSEMLDAPRLALPLPVACGRRLHLRRSARHRIHELWAQWEWGRQLREVDIGWFVTPPPPASRPSPFPNPPTRSEPPSPKPPTRLNELREGWLNPPDATEAELKKRTLTKLYNQRPTWLANAPRHPRRRRSRRLRLARRPPRRSHPRKPAGPQPGTERIDDATEDAENSRAGIRLQRAGGAVWLKETAVHSNPAIFR